MRGKPKQYTTELSLEEIKDYLSTIERPSFMFFDMGKIWRGKLNGDNFTIDSNFSRAYGKISQTTNEISIELNVKPNPYMRITTLVIIVLLLPLVMSFGVNVNGNTDPTFIEALPIYLIRLACWVVFSLFGLGMQRLFAFIFGGEPLVKRVEKELKLKSN